MSSHSAGRVKVTTSCWETLFEVLFLQGLHQQTNYETHRSTSDQCFPSQLTMKHFIPNTTKNLAQKKVKLDVFKSGLKLRKRSLRETFNMDFFKLWKWVRGMLKIVICFCFDDPTPSLYSDLRWKVPPRVIWAAGGAPECLRPGPPVVSVLPPGVARLERSSQPSCPADLGPPLQPPPPRRPSVQAGSESAGDVLKPRPVFFVSLSPA